MTAAKLSQIRDKITAGKNVLVIGDPLAGKTRTLLHALRTLKKRTDVTIPNVVDIIPEDLRIPIHFCDCGRKSCFSMTSTSSLRNEISRFFSTSGLLTAMLIVATCRKGPELKKVEAALEQIFSSTV